MIDLDKVIPRTQQERIALETLHLLNDINNNILKILKETKEETKQEEVKENVKKRNKRGE